MRNLKWAIGFAVIGALAPGMAWAQVGTPNGLRQPLGAQQTVYDYDNYLPPPPSEDIALAPGDPTAAPAKGPEVRAPAAQASPSDQPTPIAPIPAAAAASSEPCACDGCGCGQCAAAEPWKVPQPRCLQHLGIKWGGWAQMGATANGWSPPSRFNGLIACNDRTDFQLNQMWIYFDRPVNTGGCGWDVGGHVDLVYGTDWRFGKNLGLEDRINGPDQTYGMIMPQFYAEVGVNDLSVKMGHYAANFGYENIPSPGNFFYSHCFLLCYAQPLLVTGVQADYKLSDQWVVTAGFNRGWMMFEDLNETLDFLGGLRWHSCDNRTNVSFMITNGAQFVPWLPNEPNGHNRFVYGLVFDHKFTEKFQYVVQHNLGIEDGTSLVVPGRQATFYGVSQYFFYTFNPRWKGCLRFEWMQDNDGTRVAGVGNWIGSDAGWRGGPGFAGDFYELTLGLNWRPHPNLVLRPEVRWDWYSGTRDVKAQWPFNGRTATEGRNIDQFTAAMDLILTF